MYGALPYIKTPKLQTLSVSHLLDDELCARLAKLISRSGCTLSSMHIVLPYLDEPDGPTFGFRLLLQQLSSVEHLVVSDNRVEQLHIEDLDLLLLRPLLQQSPVLLPALKTLKLVDLHLDPDLLTQVVESRSQSPLSNDTEQTCALLERVEVRYSWGPSLTWEQMQFAAHYRDTL